TETRPEMEFDEERCRRSFFSYLTTASPTIWVVEKDREVIAFLLAEMYQYRAAKGIFVTQEVLFVRREYRRSRAAVLLMKELIAWGERLGAEEIVGGVDNSFNIDRTAKFLEHFDFSKVGFAMRRNLANGRR